MRRASRSGISGGSGGHRVPVEVELQFEFRGKGRLVVPISLCDLELRRSRAMSILDTYYDTTSLDLRRCGCSLRVRQAENVVRPLLTLKGPSRRRGGAKRRYEAEVQIDQLPADISDMSSLLRDSGLLGELERLAGSATPELVPIGEIRNRRSQHRYEHGLH